MALGRLFQLALAVTRKILWDEQYDFNIAVAEELDTLGEFTGVGQAKIFSDGVTNGQILTSASASASFTQKDVGDVILIVGAGVAGVDLATTIQAVTSANTVRLATATSANLTGAKFAYGKDNAAAFQAVLVSDTTIVVAPGIYMFGASIDFSNVDNIEISGYGATFIAAIPGVGPSNIFFNGGSLVGPNLALNANVAANQRQITMTAAPLSIGQVIQLTAGEPGSTYTVTNVAGAGPQTVTLDRVILIPYALAQGARVNVVTHLITRLFIKGLTFAGSCAYYIKIRGVTNSFCEDLQFLPLVSFASTGAFLQSSFSVNWGADNIVVNGPTGMGQASCEDCWVTRYTYTGTPNSPFPAAQAFQFLECANCGLEDFEINAATASGIVIDQNASGAGIPFDVGVTVQNGIVAACASTGITDAGYYTTIKNVLVIGNGSTGILLQPQSESPTIDNCRVLNNGDVGIVNSAGIATGTPSTISNSFISNNTADALTSASGISSTGPYLRVIGCTIVGVLGAANSKFGLYWTDAGLTFGCTVLVDDCDILTPGTSQGAAIVQITGNPKSVISNTRLRFNGGAAFVGSGINNLNGSMKLDNIDTILTNATVPGQGLATAAGSLTRIDEGCNFDGCTTPVAMGGFCNRSIPGSANAGSVTLNGVTPVAYGFTDTKSSDRVGLILRTRGGTPGNGAVLVAITAGTGITLAGNAGGVNDVYDVVIQ